MGMISQVTILTAKAEITISPEIQWNLQAQQVWPYFRDFGSDGLTDGELFELWRDDFKDRYSPERLHDMHRKGRAALVEAG